MKKCAIVTGGASGIGKAVAQALYREGCDIVIADLNEEKGTETAEELKGTFCQADLTEQESCRTLVDAAIEAYGRIDILVNNAGFQHVSPIEEFAEEKDSITWGRGFEGITDLETGPDGNLYVLTFDQERDGKGEIYRISHSKDFQFK